jgi:polysaccharide chain length determinant protein (PEP-CTERM system associated)
MDLRQLISAIVEQAFGMWRYRVLAAVTALATAIIGWTWVLLLPNQYDATATVYVNTDTVLRPLLQGLTVSTDKLNQVTLMTQILLTQPQLKIVAVETGLESRAKSPEELERLLETLKQDIAISRLPRQDLFRISYRDADPKMARDVVQVLVTNFMEKSLRKDRAQAGQAQEFLQEQIKLYEQRLEESEGRLAEFKKRNVGLLPGAGGDYFARLQQAEVDVAMVSGQVQALQARRDELYRQTEGEEPLLGLGGGTSPMGSGSTSVDGPIADLERQLTDLRIKVTDKHPDVLRVQQTLADLYAIRDQERERLASQSKGTDAFNLNANPVYQQLLITLSQADSELAALRQQLAQKQAAAASLRRMVDTIPVVEQEMNRLDRDYDVVKRQYDTLLQRLESARLSDEVQSDGEQVTFDVIEPPRIPFFPSAPNRQLLFAMVLVVALGLGLGVSFLFSMHSPAFYSAQSLAAMSGLPVYGSVGLTRPVRVTRQDVVVGASAGLLLLAFVTLLMVGGTGLSIGRI